VPIEALPLIAVVAIGLGLAAAALALSRSRAAARQATPPGGAAADRAEGDQLRVDQTELLRIADRLGIGVVRTDASGMIRAANDAAHRYVGRKVGGLVGRSVLEAFVDHRIEEMTSLARSNGSAQRELVFAGEPPRAVSLRAQRAEAGGGAWLTLEDVSELRRLQRIRAEFIDNLSHELRTPLTTVRLLTEALALELERTELPPRIRDSIIKIDVETGHLAQMVNELLDLSKIEQGEAPLRLEAADLGVVVERALDRLRLYADRQGVNLRGEMPAAAAERSIRGDEERLGQLLLNLLHNAIKFSTAGGDVVVRVKAEPEEIRLEVEDRGIGIAAQELDRIFERFYKVDRARQRGGSGTGLGLAIARHIAERHGGRIWAESEEGRGSVFAVAFPRSPRPG
jgi:two-component system phosphate regulon sensor histidine kinase PhoR